MTHGTQQPDLAAVVEARAAERPDAVAVDHAGGSTTWAALVTRVRRLAAALRAAGVVPGDRIAVLDLNHPSAVELTLACAQIGAANTVVNFRLAPPEIGYVIADSRARLLFVGPEFAAAVDGVRGALDTVERIVRVGGENDEYEPFLAAHEPDPGHHAAAPDDCFLQLYTSGTTGFPKGAMLTHRGVIALAGYLAADTQMAAGDVVQVPMPLFHVGGMCWALLGLSCGATIHILRTPDPVAVLDDLAHGGVTHTFVVPALLAAMAQVPGERSFPALRIVLYGASPIPLPVLRACLALFPGRMAQAYGMTEASGAVTTLPVADHEDPDVAHRLVSAGRPIAGVEIEIRDPATEEPVPVGAPGEIWVRSAGIMSGYWGNPEATAATITPDGWLRSGDGGHVDGDG